VEVRRVEARELRQRGIRVGPVLQIAQHLVEGPILLNDVNHVLDMVAQELHGRGILLADVQVEAVIPRNLGGQILQVVVFATLLGIAAAHVGAERAKPFVEFLDAAVAVLFKLTDYVMTLTPLGVFGAMAAAVSEHGIEVLRNYAKLVGSLYAALVVFVLLVFVPALRIAGVSFRRFFAKIREPFLIAFSTASSEAALPRALERLVELGVPRGVAGFVLPAGYSFNLDGSTLYIVLATMAIAQAAGRHLTLAEQVTMCLMLMLTTKGVAAVPRAALVIIAAGCGSFGLPGEAGVAMILAVESLMDMGRTSINVAGNCVAAVVVARWEGVLGTEAPLEDVSPAH